MCLQGQWLLRPWVPGPHIHDCWGGRHMRLLGLVATHKWGSRIGPGQRLMGSSIPSEKGCCSFLF